MSNNKCKSTFLFLLALVSLITLILPFLNVGFIGETPVVSRVFYYIFIAIFSVSVVLIIAIGIYSLFKNNFFLIYIQEALSYLSLICLTIIILIFAPALNYGLSVGFVILYVEVFVMASFINVLKLIYKVPKTLKTLKESYKKYKENKLKIKQQANELKEEFKNNEKIIGLPEEIKDKELAEEKVEIIPPDDELI